MALTGGGKAGESGVPFASHPDGLTLALRLTPKSGRDMVDGIAVTADGRPHVKVRVRALPVDGAANAAAVKLVARWIGVPRRDVSILSGATSRIKLLLLRGDTAALIERARSLLV